MHLEHMAFEISRRSPALEGKILSVELRFHNDKEGGERILLLARHEGRTVAVQAVSFASIDPVPYLRVLLRRNPVPRNSNLRFTVGPDRGGPE